MDVSIANLCQQYRCTNHCQRLLTCVDLPHHLCARSAAQPPMSVSIIAKFARSQVVDSPVPELAHGHSRADQFEGPGAVNPPGRR
eukprot:2530623-Rhodomonas_salina.2